MEKPFGVAIVGCGNIADPYARDLVTYPEIKLLGVTDLDPARAETLAEKPSFRGSLKYKRCLVLADGFYEWRTSPGGKVKTPYFIHMNDRKPFAFAGLWDSWNSPDGAQVKTCTIITTEPNDLMKLIHNRMPAILHPRDYGKWLDPTPQTPESMLPLIQPYPAEQMNAYPVSTQVNKPENDRPELITQVK